MTKATLTPDQIANARNAFHYALCASSGTGLSPEHVPSDSFQPQRTRTGYIMAAWNAAKATGLDGLKRPRGPVDGAPLAGSIHDLCAQLGIDANTGLPLAPVAAAPAVEETVSADEDEELVPEPHRCKDAGGYCAHCLS